MSGTKIKKPNKGYFLIMWEMILHGYFSKLCENERK